MTAKEQLFTVTCGLNVNGSRATAMKKHEAQQVFSIVATDIETAKATAAGLYHTWLQQNADIASVQTKTFYHAERPSSTSLHWAEGLLPHDE